MKKYKIVRAATIPLSLDVFCKGLLAELNASGDYEVVALSSPGKELDSVRNREGVKVVSVPMQRRMSPFKDLLSLWRLVKVFRREKPQMVHSMTPKAGLLCMMAAWMCRVPVRVHTFTGLVFPTAKGLTQKILIFTDRLTCACATHIIPEGQGVKADLENYRITSKPLKVLGHGNVRGIDLNHYNPELPQVSAAAAEIRKKGVFTFVFIGRLVRDKGINELVTAFKAVHERHPKTRLILVGPYEQTIDPISPQTVAEIDSHPAIEAVGMQRDIRPWLAASDALTFPSYREGFPNVVIEAGAMGLPSIVTDINGSREIIIEGQNGTIVPPADASSLEKAMEKFVVQPDYTGALARNARPMIESRYEQGYVRQCLKDFYRQILNEK